jgi:uncharacterized protein (TIGR02453 family)
VSEFEGFDPDAIDFLKKLGGEQADWFKARKKDYQRLIVAPSKAFVTDLGAELQSRVSAGIVAEPKTNGSIAPINNDLRFSPDKSPYKDHLLLKFWEGANKKTAPTLYVRIAPSGIGFATGAVFADLNGWRERVASQPGAELARALAKLVRGTGAEVVGADLKRVPAPYPADHPRGDLLKRLERAAPIHHWLVAALD